MRKFILMLAFVFATMFSANAQIAIENPKLLDNTYITINGGFGMPLNFDNVTPLNPSAGIAVGKWFTPVWGAELEGTLWGFESNGGGFNVPQNEDLNFGFIRGHYVGVNGLINLSNLFAGYRGAPRLFEVNTVLGMGWTHRYLKGDDNDINGLGFKTGLDFAFNLGKAKAHTLSIRPAVVWNVTPTAPRQLAMSSDYAQLYLGIGYTYHFKTSNGTHHFKTYDVGAMNAEIAALNEELAKKPKEIEVEKIVEKVVEVPVNVTPQNTYIFFAFDSDVLTDEAKETLNNISGNVAVIAFASPEGSEAYNKGLSQRRADAVKAYLESNGVTVVSAEGKGVAGNTSGRVAIVTIQ